MQLKMVYCCYTEATSTYCPKLHEKCLLINKYIYTIYIYVYSIYIETHIFNVFVSQLLLKRCHMN